MSFDVALLETLVGGPVNILILIGSAFFSIFWIGCVIFFFHWLLNKRKFDLVPLRAGQKSYTTVDSSKEKESNEPAISHTAIATSPEKKENASVHLEEKSSAVPVSSQASHAPGGEAANVSPVKQEMGEEVLPTREHRVALARQEGRHAGKMIEEQLVIYHSELKEKLQSELKLGMLFLPGVDGKLRRNFHPVVLFRPEHMFERSVFLLADSVLPSIYSKVVRMPTSSLERVDRGVVRSIALYAFYRNRDEWIFNLCSVLPHSRDFRDVFMLAAEISQQSGHFKSYSRYSDAAGKDYHEERKKKIVYDSFESALSLIFAGQTLSGCKKLRSLKTPVAEQELLRLYFLNGRYLPFLKRLMSSGGHYDLWEEAAVGAAMLEVKGREQFLSGIHSLREPPRQDRYLFLKKISLIEKGEFPALSLYSESDKKLLPLYATSLKKTERANFRLQCIRHFQETQDIEFLKTAASIFQDELSGTTEEMELLPRLESSAGECSGARLLAGLILFNDGDFRRSLAFLEKSSSPRPAVLHALAEVHHRMEDNKKALRVYSRIEKRNADDPVFLYNTAVLLESEGSIDEAIRAYYRALEFDPSNLEARKSIARLIMEAPVP